MAVSPEKKKKRGEKEIKGEVAAAREREGEEWRAGDCWGRGEEDGWSEKGREGGGSTGEGEEEWGAAGERKKRGRMGTNFRFCYLID